MLYARERQINSYITLRVPTIGDIEDHEDEYYSMVFTIISTPYDMMVQLDDLGLDFSKLTDFDLFCLLYPTLRDRDLSMIFSNGFTFEGFQLAKNKQTGETILWNRETDEKIDRLLHKQIADELRSMLFIEYAPKKPGNEDARLYMIEKARKKLKRMKRLAKMNKRTSSVLENYIIALVNTTEFKYDFDSVRGLTIYQFYASLQQITKKIQYDNTMIGVYAGTIKASEIPKEELTWIKMNEK